MEVDVSLYFYDGDRESYHATFTQDFEPIPFPSCVPEIFKSSGQAGGVSFSSWFGPYANNKLSASEYFSQFTANYSSHITIQRISYADRYNSKPYNIYQLPSGCLESATIYFDLQMSIPSFYQSKKGNIESFLLSHGINDANL